MIKQKNIYWKLFLLIGLSILLPIFITGCDLAEMDVNVTVNTDKSADISYKLLLDPYLMAYSDNFPELNKSTVDGYGFTQTALLEDNKVAIEGKKHITDYSSLNKNNLPANLGITKSNIIEIENGLFINKYRLKLDIDLDNKDEFKNNPFSGYLNNMINVSFTLNLPVKAKTSNANETLNDGKTLKWKINIIRKNELYAEFEELNYKNIIIVAVLSIIIVAIILFYTIPRKNTVSNLVHTVKRNELMPIDSQQEMDSDYCGNCGRPLLYPNKPCPICKPARKRNKVKSAILIILLIIVHCLLFIHVDNAILKNIVNKYSSLKNKRQETVVEQEEKFVAEEIKSTVKSENKEQEGMCYEYEDDYSKNENTIALENQVTPEKGQLLKKKMNSSIKNKVNNNDNDPLSRMREEWAAIDYAKESFIGY